MKEKITLAIYDENKLQKELLHHHLEQLRFDVLYSTMKVAELKEYFDQRPADVLLANGENNLQKFIPGIKNLRRRGGNLKVVFYNTDFVMPVDSENKNLKGTEFFFTSGGWTNLLSLIETFADELPVEVKKLAPHPVRLAPGNPFYKISENEKYVDILRYLKEGKSNRQIAYLLGSSIDNVKYHIKKMHDETGSNTTKMVADAVKAGLI